MNTKVFKIFKTMGTWMPAQEKEREKRKKIIKIVHVFLQKNFQVSNKRYIFKEQSRIRIATIYIHYISTHMHILI